MSFHHSPRIATKNLALYLDFSNPRCYTSGSRFCYNLVGNNTGSVLNVNHDSKYSGGMFFNGNTSHINMGSQSYFYTGSLPWSMCFWMNAGPKSTNHYVISRYNAGDVGDYYLGVIGTSAKLFALREITPFSIGGGDTIASGSVPRYICWVYNSTDSRLYADGKLNPQSITASGVIASSKNSDYINVLIGAVYSNNIVTSSYTGSIYAVQLYERALTPAEVTQNYQAMRSRFGA